MDEAAVLDLFKGADVVLSFLGMVTPPAWVVCPGVEVMVKAMKKIVEEGGSPPKFVSMSAILSLIRQCLLHTQPRFKNR